MTKPLDIARLRRTVEGELARRDTLAKQNHRINRLRTLARKLDRERKELRRQVEDTLDAPDNGGDITTGRINFQQTLLDYQSDLIVAKNDDDVFRSFFRQFVQKSGGLFGVAMVCDEEADLKIVGRFGVPAPDGLGFCRLLCPPLVNLALTQPKIQQLDAYEQAQLFPESVRRYLVGVNILIIPLSPTPGEMIGLGILYRKGEQPFTEADLKLAQLIGTPTALAVQRND